MKASVEKVEWTCRSPKRICFGSDTPALRAASLCVWLRDMVTPAGIAASVGVPPVWASPSTPLPKRALRSSICLLRAPFSPWPSSSFTATTDAP